MRWVASDAFAGEVVQCPCWVQFGGDVEPLVDRVPSLFSVSMDEDGFDYGLERLQRGAHSCRVGSAEGIDRVEYLIYRNVFPPAVAG